jgi:two-component system, NarL family, sensor histidine kinase UhpB
VPALRAGPTPKSLSPTSRVSDQLGHRCDSTSANKRDPVAAGLARKNGVVSSSGERHLDPASERPPYRPLFQRVVASNAVLLVAACLVTILVLSPAKISSFAVDEAVVLVAALALVALINVLLVRRAVAPLQAVNALARRVDLTHPGQRIPGAKPTSEAGELALSFNEMLSRLEQERRESTRRVLAAHESERLRIAQELHDEVGQTLTAVLLQLSRVQERLPGELSEELHEAQDAARESLEDVRRIATDLRPETLNDLGLASALAALGDSFGQRAGLRVRRDIQNDLPSLGGEAELVVYRVAQEALTNIARHADSDTAKLVLASDAKRLTLIVRDYGRGLPRELQPDGTGVRGMRERASLIGAELTLGSPKDGPGTEVRLVVPLRGAQ